MKATYIIVWQNKTTGKWGHGSPMLSEHAISRANSLNSEYPDICHEVLNGNEFFQWIKTKVTEEEAKNIYYKTWGHCYFA